MKVKETYLKGCFIIEPKVFKDNRGGFFESYNQQKFEEIIGRRINFVQDNISTSKRGVIRGLHMQKEPYSQSKLIKVLKGKILDVAVDFRKESPTFCKYFSIILSEKNNLQLFIPKGFLHGFSVLEEDTIVSYKCDNYYKKEAEVGIKYNDEILNINWGLQENEVLVSLKDKELKTL